MSKITVLFLDSDRDAALEALYDLGVVHVVNPKEPGGPEAEPLEGEDVRTAKEALESVRGAVVAPEDVGGTEQTRAEQVDGEDEAGPLAEAIRLTSERRQAEKTREALATELERVGPLGEFDPALVADLERRGLYVKWLRAPRDSTLVPPAGAVIDKIGADEQRSYYVVVSPMPFEASEVGPSGVAEEVRAPERHGGELKALMEEREEEIRRIDGRLAALRPLLPQLEGAVAEIEKAAAITRVGADVGASERILYLQGYIPAEELPELRAAAKENGWGLRVRDPDPTDRVPTLVRYPRAIRPIRVLFSVLRISPGYFETDVSWAFLVFFTVFVGLLVSDAGYGVLLLLLALYLIIKARGIRHDGVALLLVLSLSIIFFGTLAGSWIGLHEPPGFLETLTLHWFREQANVMDLCFLIGAVHMTIAHIWTAVGVFPRRAFLAQLGWVAIVWSMFFIARALVLERPFYTAVLYFLGGGVVLVIFFLMPFSRMREHIMEYVLLPLTLVGFFVDVVSYIRLFAVGVASVAVAESFNGMAASVGFGFPQVIFAIFIIVFGHSLNLALAVLAVLVHGVRLNTLEFSAHKGLSWSGFGFRPFGRRADRGASGAG